MLGVDEEALEQLLEAGAQVDDASVIGGVIFRGTAVTGTPVRQGYLVIGPGQLDGFAPQALRGAMKRVAAVRTGAVDGARVVAEGDRVQLTFTDASEDLLLQATVRQVSGNAAKVEATIREWCAAEHLPMAHAAEFDRSAVEAVHRTTERVIAPVSDAVDTVTFADFREAVTAAMDQLVEVVTVHDSEILSLQRRVRELEARLEEPGDDGRDG